jgi:hypothetical protein
MKDYLPIGSVVLLHGGRKTLMIYGRCVRLANEELTYDYLGCFYPEGHLSDEQRFLFDHKDIREVVYRGYSCAEEQAFVKNVLEQQDDD